MLRATKCQTIISFAMTCHVGADCLREVRIGFNWCELDPLPCHKTSNIFKIWRNRMHKLFFKFTCHRMGWCRPAALTHAMPIACHLTSCLHQPLFIDSRIAAPMNCIAQWPDPPPQWEDTHKCKHVTFPTCHAFSPHPFPILGHLGNRLNHVPWSWFCSPAAQINDATILGCPMGRLLTE